MKLNSFKFIHVLVIGSILYMVWVLFFSHLEMFHSLTDITPQGTYWWNSTTNPKIGYPFYNAPMSDDASDFGDMKLANMYRQLHNLDDINRQEVLEHSHIAIATPGGDDGINRQWYIAEGLDRERMKLQRQINDSISEARVPYSDAFAYGLPHTELGSGCSQYEQDLQGQILGIPSVPGVLHPYY